MHSFSRPTLMRWHSILSCKQLVVGSNRTITVEYSRGGHPTVLIPSEQLPGSGFCGNSANVSASPRGNNANHGGASAMAHKHSSAFIVFFTLFFGMVALSL